MLHMRPGVWPSIGVLLEVAGGILGLGLLQEAETLETGTPPTREGILILNPSYVVTGTSNDHVAGKNPFLCQRCVFSLREIAPSKLSEPVSYR